MVRIDEYRVRISAEYLCQASEQVMVETCVIAINNRALEIETRVKALARPFFLACAFIGVGAILLRRFSQH